MSKEQYPIGIDLGTVNSVVAVCRKNKIEIIKCQDLKLLPSQVFYDPNDSNDVMVGDLDHSKVKKCPKNAIRDSKRLIGRSYDDQWVKTHSNKYSFKIEPTESNGIHIPLLQNGKTVYKTPQEVSSEILKVLTKAASTYLGYTVTEAVITVPAYFTFSQRNATKQAAKLADLKVLMLLNEPTAACLHYIKQRSEQDNISLVFDLGGGTLDISVVKFSADGLNVAAVDGDTLLGGRCFDEQVLENIVDTKKLKLNDKQYRRLLNCIETVKHKLSYKDEYSTEIEYFEGEENFEVKLTRKQFEDINLGLFEKCINIIERCLKKANIKVEEIDRVILVGGSTKIPKIKQMVQDFFHGREVSTDLDPDEAVACGAAIQAASMKGSGSAKFKIVDVTPFSLGINLLFDKMRTVIKRNTPIPAENSVGTVTSFNYQSSSEFNVYEGERARCKLNNILGSYTLNNIPKKPAGQVRTITTFSVDESGLLKVTAKEESTGVSTELEVGVELHDLKSNNTLSFVQETKEDEEFLEFVGNLYRLKEPCMKYMCNKSDDEKDVKKCDQFITDLKALEFEERDKLSDLVKKFKEEISDVSLKESIV